MSCNKHSILTARDNQTEIHGQLIIGALTLLKLNRALDENSSMSDRASSAIWDHTVLPATRNKWMRTVLTPASKMVLNLPTPEEWKAELTLVTRHCTSWKSNSRPLYHKSDTLRLHYWATAGRVTVRGSTTACQSPALIIGLAVAAKLGMIK